MRASERPRASDLGGRRCGVERGGDRECSGFSKTSGWITAWSFPSSLILPSPFPLFIYFLNPKSLKAVVLIDVIAFLVFFLGIPSPISKMRGGLNENAGGGRGAVCVWEGAVKRDSRAVSAFPVPGSRTLPPGSRPYGAI